MLQITESASFSAVLSFVEGLSGRFGSARLFNYSNNVWPMLLLGQLFVFASLRYVCLTVDSPCLPWLSGACSWCWCWCWPKRVPTKCAWIFIYVCFYSNATSSGKCQIFAWNEHKLMWIADKSHETIFDILFICDICAENKHCQTRWMLDKKFCLYFDFFFES